MIVHLSSLTLFNVLALACYAVAMLLQVVSFATDNWSTVRLDGRSVRLGLWHGCYIAETPANQSQCTTDIFKHSMFNTGSAWHVGSQAMMCISLASLFFLEFVLIGYVCIKRLEQYKDKMVGAILAFSFVAGLFMAVGLILYSNGISGLSESHGAQLQWSFALAILSLLFCLSTGVLTCADRSFCHFLVLIMYGVEVNNKDEGQLGGSYGILVICLLLEIAIVVLVKVDDVKRFPKDRIFIETKPRSRMNSEDIPDKPNRHGPYTKEDKPGTRRPYTIEEHKIPKLSRPPDPVSMETAGPYYGTSGSWAGSSGSLRTQSTAFTSLSYRDGSLESLV